MVLQHVAPFSEQFLHLFLIHQAGCHEFLALLREARGREAVSLCQHSIPSSLSLHFSSSPIHSFHKGCQAPSVSQVDPGLGIPGEEDQALLSWSYSVWGMPANSWPVHHATVSTPPRSSRCPFNSPQHTSVPFLLSYDMGAHLPRGLPCTRHCISLLHGLFHLLHTTLQCSFTLIVQKGLETWTHLINVTHLEPRSSSAFLTESRSPEPSATPHGWTPGLQDPKCACAHVHCTVAQS